MKLPVNAILYLASVGLLGVAALTFSQTFPEQSQAARDKRHNRGINEARDLLAKAKSQGSRAERLWNYDNPWWKDQFLAPEIFGREKAVEKPPEDPQAIAAAEAATKVKIETLFELEAVVYDPGQGKGDLSHVILRYKDGLQVNPPDWYVRENRPAGSAVAPGDSVGGAPAAQGNRGNRGNPNQGGGRLGRGGSNPANPGAATSMPTTTAGSQYLQRVWVAGDGAKHFDNKLWEPFNDIRLARVSSDARSAFFIRIAPPAKAGEPAEVPTEVEVFKRSIEMTNEDAAALAKVLRSGSPDRLNSGNVKAVAAAAGGIWTDDPSGETKKIDGRFNIGRKDETLFRENPEVLMERVNAETYVSKTGGNLRGVVLKNVDPTLASRFGVQAGEVIIAVNGERVETKADAVATGKRQYNRGTRSFVVKFLSNGQELERIYQTPDR